MFIKVFFSHDRADFPKNVVSFGLIAQFPPKNDV